MSKLTINDLREIRRIQIRTQRLVSTGLIGAYRSAFKGQGREFLDVREFESGDDIKHIDWNVTARMNQPFVKKFQEERALTVMLVVDVSASAKFGSRDRAKSEFIAEVAGLLAFSAIDNHDRIGLLIFSGDVEKYLPPAKGRRHALRVIRELLATEGRQPGTDLGHALSFLGKIQKKSAVCFIISDFLTSDYEHQLKVAAKRYDCIAIRVLDPRELDLPSIGLLHLEDLETGQKALVDSSDVATQRLFHQKTQEMLEKQRRFINSLGVGLIDIRTDTSYLHAIRSFFHHRSQRHG